MTAQPEEEMIENEIESQQQEHTQEEKKPEVQKAASAQQNVEEEKERNWKAFLEKRKEEQKLFEAEKEKNKQLEAERVRREKEIEDMKEAFKVLVEKRESSSFEDSSDPSQDYKKQISAEFERLFDEREKKRKQKDDEERFHRDSMAIKETMPDLLEVCNQENIAYLEYYHPEIAIPLAKMPDGLEKTKMAYLAIKKHVKMAKKEKEKIEQNLSKPKSMHSSVSNEGQQEKDGGILSEKMKNETYAKMKRLISGQDEE